jgi:hypothetical protein
VAGLPINRCQVQRLKFSGTSSTALRMYDKAMACGPGCSFFLLMNKLFSSDPGKKG